MYISKYKAEEFHIMAEISQIMKSDSFTTLNIAVFRSTYQSKFKNVFLFSEKTLKIEIGPS